MLSIWTRLKFCRLASYNIITIWAQIQLRFTTPTSVFEKAPLLCIKPNPVVRKHKYIFLEECRTRSACTYTQSDHALHSSQLNPIRILDMCRLIIVFIISSQANPMPFKQSKSACVLVIVAALYFYSVLKSVYGGSHTVCWVKALQVTKPIRPRACSSHVIV